LGLKSPVFSGDIRTRDDADISRLFGDLNLLSISAKSTSFSEFCHLSGTGQDVCGNAH
jgi:hypothetical protein